MINVFPIFSFSISQNNSLAISEEKKLVEKLTKQNFHLEKENKSMADKLKMITAQVMLKIFKINPNFTVKFKCHLYSNYFQNVLHLKNTAQQNMKILAHKANFERINNLFNETSSKLSKTLSELENLKYEKENLTKLLDQKTNILMVK